MRSVWEILEIEPTKDIALIKEAFSKRSKEVHPEEDPIAFQELRAAYNFAMNTARKRPNVSIGSPKEKSFGKLGEKETFKSEEKKLDFTTQEEILSKSEKKTKETLQNEERKIDFTAQEEILKKKEEEAEAKKAFILELKEISRKYPKKSKVYAEFFNNEEYIRYRNDDVDFAIEIIAFLKEQTDKNLGCRAILKEQQKIWNRHPKRVREYFVHKHGWMSEAETRKRIISTVVVSMSMVVAILVITFLPVGNGIRAIAMLGITLMTLTKFNKLNK